MSVPDNARPLLEGVMRTTLNIIDMLAGTRQVGASADANALPAQPAISLPTQLSNDPSPIGHLKDAICHLNAALHAPVAPLGAGTEPQRTATGS